MIGVWHKVGFVPHPYFLVFCNEFIGFVEYNIGCGKMSTLRHTLNPVNTRVIERKNTMNMQRNEI